MNDRLMANRPFQDESDGAALLRMACQGMALTSGLDPHRAYQVANVPMGMVIDTLQAGGASLEQVAELMNTSSAAINIVFRLSDPYGKARIMETLLQVAPEINVDTHLLRHLFALKEQQNQVMLTYTLNLCLPSAVTVGDAACCAEPG